MQVRRRSNDINKIEYLINELLNISMLKKEWIGMVNIQIWKLMMNNLQIILLKILEKENKY